MAQLTAERFIRALGRLGWERRRQSGSHAVLVQPGGGCVTVPIHRGKPLKEGTARAILKETGVTEDELFEVC